MCYRHPRVQALTNSSFKDYLVYDSVVDRILAIWAGRGAKPVRKSLVAPTAAKELTARKSRLAQRGNI